MTDADTTEAELEAQIGAYAKRIFQTGLASLEAITISLGRELGLYDHLPPRVASPRTSSPNTPASTAATPREWLEQQATAGLIEVTAPSTDAEARRYTLSQAGQECLLRPESLASVGPLIDLIPAVVRVFPTALVDAFRSGRGIPYADHALHDAQGDFNRPAFEPPRVGLAAIDSRPHQPARRRTGASRRDRLRRRMGRDQSGQGLAQHRGRRVDNDEASIVAARKHAAEAGVGDRVRFEVVDVTRILSY